MARVYNFSAGPSTLPESVLRRAAGEMLEHGSSGQSVMEMSHRSAPFEKILSDCQSSLRSVMGIPDNYRILFIQGGASLQFSAIPLNLSTPSGRAGYAVTGQFAKKAFQEGGRFCEAVAVTSSAEQGFRHIPPIGPVDQTLDYLHICYNNTIYGTCYPAIPDTGSVPLVADMSSYILSEPFDVSRFDVIYAGVQKNMAPAGMAVVIVREDLLGHAQPIAPTLLDWNTYAKNDSMYNTPPCYTIYMLGLVLDWIKNEIGGLAKMQQHNQRKAKHLYDYLDQSRLFTAIAEREHRSLMNVTFVTGDADLDARFIRETAEAGFVNLKGHRTAGGMRASIYNAMPEQGVQDLVAFMEAFENHV